MPYGQKGCKMKIIEGLRTVLLLLLILALTMLGPAAIAITIQKILCYGIC